MSSDSVHTPAALVAVQQRYVRSGPCSIHSASRTGGHRIGVSDPDTPSRVCWAQDPSGGS